MLDEVADERIHLGAEFVDVVIAGRHDPHATQIGRRRCEDFHRNEMSEFYQLGDLRTFNHHLEYIAEAATVASARRCRQSDDDRVWIGLDDPLVRHRADVVTFVNEDDFGRRQFHSVCAHASPIKGLHAGDLH